MAETIAVVRLVKAFELVYRNPQKQFHAPTSTLRASSLEPDWAAG